LEIDGDKVSSFAEKKDNADVWVNGGFFVVNSGVFDYIPDGDEAVFEEETLHKLVRDDQVLAHKHTGFWRCMDTLKDKNDLNEIWNSGNVPWRMR
jgi:glucose-1-phosphate cytidylyltransferase